MHPEDPASSCEGGRSRNGVKKQLCAVKAHGVGWGSPTDPSVNAAFSSHLPIPHLPFPVLQNGDATPLRVILTFKYKRCSSVQCFCNCLLTVEVNISKINTSQILSPPLSAPQGVTLAGETKALSFCRALQRLTGLQGQSRGLCPAQLLGCQAQRCWCEQWDCAVWHPHLQFLEPSMNKGKKSPSRPVWLSG